MRIPGVEISMTWGRIGLRQRRPEVSVSRTPVRVQVASERPGVEIEQDHARVEVDMYPSRYDLGYRTVLDFIREAARDGLEAAGEEAARYAREGDRLMAVAGEAGAGIPELVRERVEGEQPQADLVWIRGPDLNVVPHRIAVDHRRGGLRFDVRSGQVDLQFRRGRVAAYLRQEPELEVEVRVDRRV